jgi:transcription termination factor Rho
MYIHMVTPPPNGAGLDIAKATEAIIKRIAHTENNLEFLETLTEENF